jgi:hypothetical protein
MPVKIVCLCKITISLLCRRRCNLARIMRRKMWALLDPLLGFGELTRIIWCRIGRRLPVCMMSLLLTCSSQRLFSRLYCEIAIGLGFSLNFIFFLSFVLPLILNPTI